MPDKHLLFLMFIVTESGNRDMSLQILVPPTRLRAEEGLGVVGTPRVTVGVEGVIHPLFKAHVQF